MFTIVFYNQDKDRLDHRCYENPEIMMDWVKKYYQETDWADDGKFPIKIFADCPVPLKCMWTAHLAPDDANVRIMDAPKTKSKRGSKKQKEEDQEDF